MSHGFTFGLCKNHPHTFVFDIYSGIYISAVICSTIRTSPFLTDKFLVSGFLYPQQEQVCLLAKYLSTFTSVFPCSDNLYCKNLINIHQPLSGTDFPKLKHCAIAFILRSLFTHRNHEKIADFALKSRKYHFRKVKGGLL